MTTGRQPVIQQLREILGRKTLILGIGNTLREDDGIGPYFALLCRHHGNVHAFDCGDAPEKYIGKAISFQPDTVVLVDAADFGGQPGEPRLLGAEAIPTRGISTHDMPLRLLVEYLADRAHTAVVLLAFQPRSTRLGRELSEELKRSARDLARDLGLTPPASAGEP